MLTLGDDLHNVRAASAFLLAFETRGLQQFVFTESPMLANVVVHSKRPWSNVYESQPSNGGGRGSYGYNSNMEVVAGEEDVPAEQAKASTLRKNWTCSTKVLS